MEDKQMRCLSALVTCVALLLGASRCAASQNAEALPREQIAIKVEDASGAPLMNDLVIVHDLNDRSREVLRTLTDSKGDIPAFELQTGLYRVIATFPYGDIWETEVQEFLVVKGQAKQITLKIRPMGTHGYGDVIPTPGPKIQAQVLTADGAPASGASVLVRDKDVTLYLLRWYKTDAKGKATIELVAAPLHQPTVVVAVYQDVLVTQEVMQNTHRLVIHLPRN
jgi:hypothetical protein